MVLPQSQRKYLEPMEKVKKSLFHVVPLSLFLIGNDCDPGGEGNALFQKLFFFKR